MKQYDIPTVDEIRAVLKPLDNDALRQLAKVAGLHSATLIKIRDGGISDPGIVTVSRFLPHIPLIRQVFVDMVQTPRAQTKREARASAATAPAANSPREQQAA